MLYPSKEEIERMAKRLGIQMPDNHEIIQEMARRGSQIDIGHTSEESKFMFRRWLAKGSPLEIILFGMATGLSLRVKRGELTMQQAADRGAYECGLLAQVYEEMEKGK